MKAFLRHHYDKLLFALASLLCAASVVGSFLASTAGKGLRGPAADPTAAMAHAHTPAALRAPDTATVLWGKPASQSRGAGWIYEVFTPPVIYYNTYAKSFTVTPPLVAGDVERPFGLEVLDVKRELYRLQLVGYFGAPGDYTAAFVNPGQPATLFGREGSRFEGLGLRLKHFQLRKVVVPNEERLPVFDVAAVAVLTDEATGADVELDSRARKFTDVAVAILRAEGTPGRGRELRVGETLDVGAACFKVERIGFDPPEVVVAKSEPGISQPEVRLLKPAKVGEPKPAKSTAEALPDRSVPAARTVATSLPQP